MLAVALALTSSVLWGLSDFLGGVVVRRFGVAAVAVLSQASGLFAVGLAVAVIRPAPEANGILIGLVAGTVSSISVTSFFKAMELGLISIASPLLACGSVLAFSLAVAGGERPSRLAVGGAVLALGGAVVASLRERASGGGRKSALAFAFLSAIALGFALYLLGRASDETGSLFAVLSSRASSLFVIVLVASRLHPTYRIAWSWLAVVIAVGASSAAALIFFGLAAETGLLSIASILSSLYPIVTVMLAHAFLNERLGRSQVVGVTLVVAGIGLVTATQ